MPKQRVTFPIPAGVTLARLLETPLASALFAHCFTCSKDSKAGPFIARASA